MLETEDRRPKWKYLVGIWQNEVLSGLELLSGRVQPNDLLGINDRLKNAAAVVKKWLKSPLKNLKIFIGSEAQFLGGKNFEVQQRFFKKKSFLTYFSNIVNLRRVWKSTKFLALFEIFLKSSERIKEQRQKETSFHLKRSSAATFVLLRAWFWKIYISVTWMLQM